jgi:hypothetical protein
VQEFFQTRALVCLLTFIASTVSVTRSHFVVAVSVFESPFSITVRPVSLHHLSPRAAMSIEITSIVTAVVINIHFAVTVFLIPLATAALSLTFNSNLHAVSVVD